MSLRWSEEQLQSLLKGMHEREGAPRDRRDISQARKSEIASMGGRARATKYGNVITHVDGIRFDSKKEAQYYQQLLLMKAGHAIKGFARQVSIPLPSGKRRIRLDFVVTENDGRIRWIDAKGYATNAWKIQRAEAEAMLGIEIETV
jgi:hypothetical protein